MSMIKQPEWIPSQSVTDEDLKTQTVHHGPQKTIQFPEDIKTIDQMSVIEASGSLDFWDDPDEDKYQESDGDAV